MGIGYEEVAILAFILSLYCLGQPCYAKWLAMQRVTLGLAMILLTLFCTLSVIYRNFTAFKSTT